MLLLAAVTALVDPIASSNVTAHVFPRITCAHECRVITASLKHVDGTLAVSSPGGACDETVQLELLPFGARLVPHVDYLCHGQRRTETGEAVTVAPYVWNVAVDGTSVSAHVYAKPRSGERVRLKVIGPGLEATGLLERSPFVLKNVVVAPGRWLVTATLEPYGAVSNTRAVRVTGDATGRVSAEGAGCGAPAVLLAVVLFRRRRFPFSGRFC
ncbi:MAG: hypothetical protein JNK82_00770 [Myxococcaceae bacterium]|nr:hypothetical protein [Myxococcaceae bacterium]